jgi:tetratricopeptide (TPR) repeat protein
VRPSGGGAQDPGSAPSPEAETIWVDERRHALIGEANELLHKCRWATDGGMWLRGELVQVVAYPGHDGESPEGTVVVPVTVTPCDGPPGELQGAVIRLISAARVRHEVLDAQGHAVFVGVEAGEFRLHIAEDECALVEAGFDPVPSSSLDAPGRMDIEHELASQIRTVSNDHHRACNLAAGKMLLDEVIERAEREELPKVLAQACVEMGTNRRHAGCRSEAEMWAVRAVRLSSQVTLDRRDLILALNELGMVTCRSDFDWHFKQAQLLLEDGDTDLRARLDYGLARSAWKRGECLPAIEKLRDCLEQYAELPDTYGVARANARLGMYLRLRGEFPEAVTHLESAFTVAREYGFVRIEANALVDLGHLDTARGNTEEARTKLNKARRLYETMGHPAGRANALSALANVERQEGNLARAIDWAKEACDLSQKQDAEDGQRVSPGTALALRRWGECLYESGTPEKAVGPLDQARRAYRRLGNPDGEALTLATKARILKDHDHDKTGSLNAAMYALDLISEMPGRFWQGTDMDLVTGRHSWCYETVADIAQACGDRRAVWKATNAAELDRNLRELRRGLLRGNEGVKPVDREEVKGIVRRVLDVELAIRPPAFDPLPGIPVACATHLLKERDKLLDALGEYMPLQADALREGVSP